MDSSANVDMIWNKKKLDSKTNILVFSLLICDVLIIVISHFLLLEYFLIFLCCAHLWKMQIIEFTLCFILNLRFSSLISPFLHEKQCCIENEYLNSQMCRKDFLSPVPDYIRPNSSCSVCSKLEVRSPAVAPPEHWVKMEKDAQLSLSKSPPETIVQQPDSLKLKPLI